MSKEVGQTLFLKMGKIKNFNELATTQSRKFVLDILEAGISAIDTEFAIKNSIKLEGNNLVVQGKSFDLKDYKNIKVIGFGKASCDAAVALEKVLGEKIKEGVVIGLEAKTCEYIQTYSGTHPRPSDNNLEIGNKIAKLAESASVDDLFIVVVSGGGSALLCYPESECYQGQKLYDASIKSGITIKELNIVRKHISKLKGGGLAKVLYPAKVISLIFSDVPGDELSDVASGPTFFDETTIEDAKAVIEKYNLGEFVLNETIKDKKYFENVNNFVLVSNKMAIDAMERKAKSIGFTTNILSYEIYDDIDSVFDKFYSASLDKKSIILGAGEPIMKVKKKGGSGGRNLYLAMKSINKIQDGISFVSFASDGLDNGESAGAIIDMEVKNKLISSGLNINDYIDNYDAFNLFEKLGDGMILTGPTGSNVSDIMMLLKV